MSATETGTVYIERFTRPTEGHYQEILGLMPTLSSSFQGMTYGHFQSVVRNPCNNVYLAVYQRLSLISIVGMVMRHDVEQFAGRKSWIEDVVVLPDFQGMGIAKRLMQRAIEEVPEGTKSVNLTSKFSREAAHGLYTSLGFKLRNEESGLFRLDLTKVA